MQQLYKVQIYHGVVENRKDPLKLGRCQVRVAGLHSHDKNLLPTEDLPWAYPLQPVTSAAISGIGHSPVGPVEGTWVIIVFRDDDEQFPIMIGTVGGIPQDNGEVDKDLPGMLLKDDDGNVSEASTDVVTNNDGETVPTSGVKTATPTTSTALPDIPRIPPPDWRGDRTAAARGIEALLAACDKFGMTTREQKCSVLAIAGGESGWIPQSEQYSYSAEGLKSTFYTTFVKNHPDQVEAYTRATKKMSREEFFDFVYDPSNNGKQLGNTQPGDGGKFFGRGFIQITGRSNYATYAQKSGFDILSNPELLNSDIAVSAGVACLYIKDRLKPKSTLATDNPGYFYAAKAGIGHDTGNGAAVRLKYYEYFYGTPITSDLPEEKTASTSAPTDPVRYDQPAPTIAGPTGFKDPNNKYPLKSRLYEPDTNRLARGIKKNTVHTIKDTNRAIGIDKALGQGEFSEPPTSYAAKYPFNHVFESESGHVQEFDDTPGYERTLTYHRKGTFTEVDANGTEVHHVVGDKYEIIDRNGSIYIRGECNLTTDGNINIFCQSSANIEVTGDANVQVGNDLEIGVAKDLRMAVGGSMELFVNDNLNIQAANINIEGTSSYNLSASNYYETVGTSYYRWNGDKHMFTGGNTYERHDSGVDHSCPADPSRSGSTDCSSVDSASEPDITKSAPDVGVPLNIVLPFLVAPTSDGEAEFQFETEEDWATPEGQAKRAELESKYPVPPVQDQATPLGGTNTATVVPCDIVNGVEKFTNDFRLSANFTLGMLIDGGVDGPNKLKDQVGLTKQQIVCNLAQLCANILEPALAILPGGAAGYGKQWTINSGYRSAGNAANSTTSDHPYGRAVDISVLPKDADRKQRHFDLIQELEKVLPYDQMILEYQGSGSTWIHIGYRGLEKGQTTGQGAANRKMAFTMVNGSTYKQNGQSGFFLV